MKGSTALQCPRRMRLRTLCACTHGNRLFDGRAVREPTAVTPFAVLVSG